LRGDPIYLFVLDQASETCIADGSAERLKFFARSFGDEFDAAIGQIADETGDLKTGGDGFYGMAEPHALHAA
jgi:hypothetical protein